MRAGVQLMETGDLVDLVNAWATRPREIGARPAPPGDAGDRPGVADRLFAVFAAAPAERAGLVSDMLDDTGVRPGLVENDGELVPSWWVSDERSVLLASAALSLREHLATAPERLGICADDHCSDVYADASPAGHRRFCSLTCQNRTRVAAFRERRRNAATDTSPEDD